jgi:hypothetical protein
MRAAMLTLGAVLISAHVAHVASAADMLPLRDAVPNTTAAAQPPAVWDGGGVANEENNAPISPARAVLYSLLLPGLGDYQLGNKGRATAFFAAEGIIWISYATFEVQGHQREDDYQDLAVRFAGVSRTGHSDDFYARVREFDNSDQYEANVKNTGRQELYNPYDLESINADALENYFVEKRVSDYEPWKWASLDRRVQYSETRSASKTSYRRADYMIAAAVANRLVSAVVAFTAARNVEPQGVGYHFDFTPAARGVDVSLTLTHSF